MIKKQKSQSLDFALRCSDTLQEEQGRRHDVEAQKFRRQKVHLNTLQGLYKRHHELESSA